MERMIIPAIKFLALLAFVSLYCTILPLGFEVIDPCSATPGQNFTIGYIMLILFPLLLGLLLYLMYWKRPYRFTAYLKIVLLAFASLLLAVFFLRVETRLIETYLPYQFFLVEHDCYGDVEMKERTIIILSIINISTIIGLVIKLVVGKKTNQ